MILWYFCIVHVLIHSIILLKKLQLLLLITVLVHMIMDFIGILSKVASLLLDFWMLLVKLCWSHQLLLFPLKLIKETLTPIDLWLLDFAIVSLLIAMVLEALGRIYIWHVGCHIRIFKAAFINNWSDVCRELIITEVKVN